MMLPRDVFPPGGDIAAAATPYRVLVWTGARVEELATRDDRAEALRLMRASTIPAALAQGESVLQHNGRGKTRERAFVAFAKESQPLRAEAPSKPSRDRTLPRQTPAEPMPDRDPVAPIVEPVAPIVARPVEIEPATRVETMADVEAILASDDAEAAERESGKAPAPTCSKCNEEPRASVTKRTKPGTESWGSKCRAREPSQVAKPAANSSKKSKGSAVNSPRIPESSKRPASTRTAPSQSPKARASTSLDEALAIVERNAALIARLGGTATATELADTIEAHGGPAAVITALRRVLAVAEGRA
jgi:hypothetical protein